MRCSWCNFVATRLRTCSMSANAQDIHRGICTPCTCPQGRAVFSPTSFRRQRIDEAIAQVVQLEKDVFCSPASTLRHATSRAVTVLKRTGKATASAPTFRLQRPPYIFGQSLRVMRLGPTGGPSLLGRMSTSKIRVGIASVVQQLGTSTMALMRPSHGQQDSRR